jgi:hypothetical protein
MGGPKEEDEYSKRRLGRMCMSWMALLEKWIRWAVCKNNDLKR